VVVHLRHTLLLPLDDLLAVTRELLNPPFKSLIANGAIWQLGGFFCDID